MSAERKFQVLPGNEARQMPASLEAERHVLACCMLDEGATLVRALQDGVTAKAFFSAANALVWETLVELFRAGRGVSLEVVAEELSKRQQLEAIGGPVHLMQLAEGVTTTTHANYFIEALLEKSALRAAVRIGTETAEKAYAYAGGGLDALFAEQLSALSACVRHARRGSTMVALKEKIDAVLAETTAAVEGKLDTSGWIYTGLPTFDQRCRPLGCQTEDHLIVDAAGSGLGKSAFMRQVAGETLRSQLRDPKREQRVRAYSRETTAAGFIEQMAATWAEVDLKHRDRWTPDMLKKFAESCDALRHLADRRLWCVENTQATPILTIEELEDDARYFAATQGAPHLWVVDYLQLFGAKKRFASREQEVAYVSHRLQALCRELGGVWLVGCQMNERGLAEMRTVRRDSDDKVIHRLPNAGDLRESQAIYHDADRVLAHYLPPVDSREQDQTSPNIEKPEVWLCQIKRRKGATGVVKTWFEKRFTRFVELPAFTPSSSPASGNSPARGGSAEGVGFTKRQFKGDRT